MTMMIKPEKFNHVSINSLQTTRLGGNSQKPYDSMNLGVFGVDNDDALKNIASLTESNNLPHSPVFLEQIHGKNVVEYVEQPKQHGLIKADGCYTRRKGVVCAILTADCLPVLMTDKQSTVVAAIHCGWKGLYSEIISEMVKKINVLPEDLLCWLGPCISYKPYRCLLYTSDAADE